MHARASARAIRPVTSGQSRGRFDSIWKFDESRISPTWSEHLIPQVLIHRRCARRARFPTADHLSLLLLLLRILVQVQQHWRTRIILVVALVLRLEREFLSLASVGCRQARACCGISRDPLPLASRSLLRSMIARRT